MNHREKSSIRIVVVLTVFMIVASLYPLKAETKAFASLGIGVQHIGYDAIVTLDDADSTYTEFDGEDGLAVHGELGISLSRKWDFVLNLTGFSSDLKTRVGEQKSGLWRGSGNLVYHPVDRISLGVGACASQQNLSYRFHADSLLSWSGSGLGINLAAGYELPLPAKSSFTIGVVWAYQKIEDYRIIAFGPVVSYRSYLHFK